MKNSPLRSSLMTRGALGALSIACLWGLVPTSEAHAAGFQNMSQSATANGMGSMGTANPDEPNASFYNGANLALREGFEVYVGDTILLPGSTYESLDGSVQAETVSQVFPPPNFHLGVPIDLKGAGTLGLGMGVTLPYGLGIAWEDDWVGRAYIISQDLQTFNFNPNLSYKVPNIDLALGVGAQIYHANVKLVRKVILRDDTEVLSTIAGSGQGYGATASMMYRPNQHVSLGLNYRSAVTLDIDGKARFEGEEDTPFEQTFVDQGGSTAISIPHALTFGVGWTYDKVFVGLDVNYTTWSRNQQTVLEFERPCQQGSQTCDPSIDRTDPPTSIINSNWNDAMAFRLGLQYEVVEDLKIRTGFVYDMTPVPEQTLSPSLPDNDRAVISGGIGYTLKGVRGDFGYQYVKALRREVRDTENLPGVYETSAHVFGVNLGYGY